MLVLYEQRSFLMPFGHEDQFKNSTHIHKESPSKQSAKKKKKMKKISSSSTILCIERYEWSSMEPGKWSIIVILLSRT